MPATKPATKVENAPFRLACFTIFDMDFDFEKLREKLQFYCRGREVCPTTGRDHWQCYGYSKTAQRDSWWRKLLYPFHVEKCRGDLASNEAYCSKSGQWEEWGEKPMANGIQKGLLGVKRLLDSGQTYRDCVKEEACFETCIKYERALKSYHADNVRESMYSRGFVPKKIIVHVGPPGLFKTRHIHEAHHGELYVMPDLSMQWAGNYQGQRAVLFDDVCDKSIMSLATFLKITDGYPFEVPVKGGYVSWTPEFIYFTSNQKPGEWFPTVSDLHYQAIKRRISCVKEYLSDGRIMITHGEAEVREDVQEV